MVPIYLTCPHCLQKNFFVHLFHLYARLSADFPFHRFKVNFKQLTLTKTANTNSKIESWMRYRCTWIHRSNGFSLVMMTHLSQVWLQLLSKCLLDFAGVLCVFVHLEEMLVFHLSHRKNHGQKNRIGPMRFVAVTTTRSSSLSCIIPKYGSPAYSTGFAHQGLF